MKKLLTIFTAVFLFNVLFVCLSFSQSSINPFNHQHPQTIIGKILTSAEQQTQYTLYYDPAYIKLKYPGGDVSLERGVCSDVIVRAFRAADIDLQKEVHEDMAANFSAYPKRWGLKTPDTNIDHRRVANLMTYFKRKGYELDITKDPKQYKAGDIVAWELDNKLLHIGVVSDVSSTFDSSYQIIHNIGYGTKLEPKLFAWKIIGHYRLKD
jgi:uncharacterized protein YijF (DUF1287 family)